MEHSTSIPTINNIPSPSLMVGSDSTWCDRLMLNLLSYSFILFPVAVIVFATKFKLFPSSIHNSILIQLFVYGNNNNTMKLSKSKDVNDHDNKSLLSGQTVMKHNQTNQESDLNRKLTFVWCFLGLQVSYLIWGVLQEKIMTTEYEITNNIFYDRYKSFNETHLNVLNKDNENLHLLKSDKAKTITFHDSQFLVFINRIIAFILSIIALVYNRPKRSNLYGNSSNIYIQSQQNNNQKPQAPLYEYIYCSLSNILSSWCQYEALKYVNFPTQVLSKSCKIIPVMLMSKLMLKKKYKSIDYLCAIFLSIGLFIFLINQPILDKRNNQFRNFIEDNNASYDEEKLNLTNQINNEKIKQFTHNFRNSSLMSGLLILSLYLAFDSFTSNWQQSLFSNYGISNWQMMAATNFYSILLTITSLQQLGTLKPAFEMLASSKLLFFDCLLMSIMSSIGQLFVYYTIKRFGSVIFAVIMTLRQFLAILLSCTIYGHQLTFSSASGLVLVFFVIGYQIYAKTSKRNDVSNDKAKTSAVSYNNHHTQIQFNGNK